MTINYNTENIFQQNNSKKTSEMLAKIQSFFEFASKKNIHLGYLRGPSFSDPFLRKLMKTDPFFLNLELIPEIWINSRLNFSLDVEFERGKELIDHFKEFKIFRLPIVDIIKKTEELSSNKLPYKKYLDNSPEFLKLFGNGKLDQVWGFDQIPIIKPYEEIFQNEDLLSIEDALNLYLLNTIGNLDLLNEYQDRKNYCQKGNSDALSVILNKNFGTIIYHEDVIEIIHNYSGWSYLKCDLFRRKFKNISDGGKDWEEIHNTLPSEVATSLLKNCKNTFSKAHLFSTYSIIKKSLILRNFFEETYLKAIRFFEQKFSVPWNYYEK